MSARGPAVVPAARERGQAAVETALVLPLIMAVALALVQVGLLVRDHVLVVHAAREAARAAAVDPTTEAAADAALAATSLNPDRLLVETQGSRTTGGLLQVTVRFRPEPAVPLVGGLFPSVTIQETLTVRVE
ncbi:MAG: pilus assembly protein [Acidimicrobiia bacterium]|nr:pilus assembly protein [Acidimicrobiia bacterium]MYG72708.1 pilus assembly protein [Acidimicrobiia bacterium]MYH95125.1 pilus assembly protein [Acidimicrobiia bacterium]MYL10292.1 pilus assembly protein [Acidimicrobiia bacterium]